MPEWFLTTLGTVAVALLISYGNKRISQQSTKLAAVTADHEKEMARVKADHGTQIQVMRATYDQQIASLQESVGRLQTDLKEVRALYTPTQAENRSLHDYIGVLRHGYSELGKVPPAWPAELRGH